MALTPCLECGALSRSGSRCARCRVASEATRSRGRLVSEPHRRLYRTKAWQRARAAAMARDRYACRCGRTDALEVHHVVSLAEGGDPFALENLETLCRSCHRRRDASRERR